MRPQVKLDWENWSHFVWITFQTTLVSIAWDKHANLPGQIKLLIFIYLFECLIVFKWKPSTHVVALKKEIKGKKLDYVIHIIHFRKLLRFVYNLCIKLLWWKTYVLLFITHPVLTQQRISFIRVHYCYRSYNLSTLHSLPFINSCSFTFYETCFPPKYCNCNLHVY